MTAQIHTTNLRDLGDLCEVAAQILEDVSAVQGFDKKLGWVDYYKVFCALRHAAEKYGTGSDAEEVVRLNPDLAKDREEPDAREE